jgi:Ala-tRNA(Pro) deacylase
MTRRANSAAGTTGPGYVRKPGSLVPTILMSPTVFERIEQLLHEQAVPFDVTRHRPVYTSEEAAAVRGTLLCSGAKALVVKVDDAMKLFVLPADRKLSSKKVRATGCRRVRFASADEVVEITALKPGAIPPFGSLFALPTICDLRLGDNPTINFNAGDHGISISMAYKDFVRVERPLLADVAE